MKTVTDKDKLKAAALRYLSYRSRSRSEIDTFLSKKTSDRNLINQIITELEESQLIDDAQFASWVVESRSRSRPVGTRRLAQELKAKGIDPGLISKAVSQVSGIQMDLAAAALSKKVTFWRHLPYREFYAKATRFLVSRGFSWEVVGEAVKKAYHSGHDDE